MSTHDQRAKLVLTLRTLANRVENMQPHTPAGRTIPRVELVHAGTPGDAQPTVVEIIHELRVAADRIDEQERVLVRLRDAYRNDDARAAMAALLTADDGATPALVAHEAFGVADAMAAEREKQP